MHYVDEINVSHGGGSTQMYSTAGTHLKKVCMQNKLSLLEASVRHLGTDINYVVLNRLYEELKDKVDFRFRTRQLCGNPFFQLVQRPAFREERPRLFFQ